MANFVLEEIIRAKQEKNGLIGSTPAYGFMRAEFKPKQGLFRNFKNFVFGL